MATVPMLLGTYDPNAVEITLAGPTGKIDLVGWADGEILSVERNEEYFNNKVGTMGEVSRAMNRNNTCQFTLRLQATSPSIKALEDLKIATSLLKVPPIMALNVYDPSSYETVAVAQCWIQKDPARGYSNEVGIREYMFFGVYLLTASNNAISAAANLASVIA